MNYYQFHIGDYVSDTAHLEPIEDLAYRRMLDVYYQGEEPLTSDTLVLAKRLRLGLHETEIKNVLSEFFTLSECGNFYYHKRCEKDIKAFQEKSTKAKNSANARWTHSEGNAKAMRTHSEGNANQEPLTINHKPITNINLNTEDGLNIVSLPAQPEKRKSSSVKGFRMPNDWVLRKDQGEWALKERPDLNPDEVRKLAEAFRDHFVAKTGKGSTSTDWNLNWHNWVRNDIKFNGQRLNGNHYGKKPDVGERAFARLREIQEAHQNGIGLGSLDDPL